jgi:hypothetical protein
MEWMEMVQGRQIPYYKYGSISMSVIELLLNKERYVEVLEKLIGETEFLQDSPPKYIP